MFSLLHSSKALCFAWYQLYQLRSLYAIVFLSFVMYVSGLGNGSIRHLTDYRSQTALSYIHHHGKGTDNTLKSLVPDHTAEFPHDVTSIQDSLLPVRLHSTL
jgi:hypothetical protein